MAVTIQNNIGNSLNDAMYFVLSSTNSGQADFKYIADVYVSSNLVARLKVFPSPESGSNKYGIVEVSRIVGDYLSKYFDPQDGYQFYGGSNDNIKVDFTMKFGESYGGSDYYNQASGSYSGYNYYDPTFIGIDSKDTFSNYDILTDRDIAAVETEYDTPCYVSLGNPSKFDVIGVTVTRYSEGWNTIATGTDSFTNDSVFQLYNICPYAIDNDGIIAIQTSDYGYGVKFTIDNGSSQYDTAEIRVKLKCTNPKGTTIPVTFMNRLGGYDTLNFSMVNRQRLQIEDKVYKQNQYRLSGISMVKTEAIASEIYRPSSIKYYAKHTTSILLRSDYINEKDYNWIKDLIASTDVYISFKEQNSYEWKFYPVIVKTLNWEEKKRAADKMFNVEIEVEVANEIYSQYK